MKFKPVDETKCQKCGKPIDPDPEMVGAKCFMSVCGECFLKGNSEALE